jgi:LCP family protein required for cell wall assembly
MSGHPILAAILSALIPGAGQLFARRPLRALVFFVPTIAVLGGVYAFYDLGAIGMAGLLVRPSFLTGLLIFDVVFLVWRLAAVVDAFLITSQPGDRSWLRVPMTFLLLVVAVPHLFVFSYGADTLDTLNTTFVAASEADAFRGPNAIRIPAPVIGAPAEPAGPHTIRRVYRDSPRAAIFEPSVGDPDAVAIWLDIANSVIVAPPYEPSVDPLDTDRLTILLVGGDAGPGREGLRTDSMNVVTIDLITGQAALFGFPRNLKLMPLPTRFETAFVDLEEKVIEKDLTDLDEDGYPDTWYDQDGDLIPDEPPFETCNCFPTLLNEVHQYTKDWTGTYPYSPDPGLSALKDILSNAMGLPIDYFVMVDMAGFVDVIDAIGGVDVLVKEPYHVTVSSPEEGKPKATVNVEPGMNHLDGLEALAYSRWRIGSSDYHRMRRQRCLVRAAVTQTSTVTVIKAYPDLLELMRDSITTDIPIDALPDLVWAAGQIDFDNVATVGFVPPTYNSGRTPGKYPIPDIDRIRWKVRDVLENGVQAQSRSGESECD